MIISDENGVVIEVIEGEGFIHCELENQKKVRYIDVSILKPRLSSDKPPATCWAVDNIRLTSRKNAESLTN